MQHKTIESICKYITSAFSLQLSTAKRDFLGDKQVTHETYGAPSPFYDVDVWDVTVQHVAIDNTVPSLTAEEYLYYLPKFMLLCTQYWDEIDRGVSTILCMLRPSKYRHSGLSKEETQKVLKLPFNQLLDEWGEYDDILFAKHDQEVVKGWIQSHNKKLNTIYERLTPDQSCCVKAFLEFLAEYYEDEDAQEDLDLYWNKVQSGRKEP